MRIIQVYLIQYDGYNMEEHGSNQPFLWDFINKISLDLSSSDGGERPLTATVAEENPSKLVKSD